MMIAVKAQNPFSESFSVVWEVHKSSTKHFPYLDYNMNSHLLGEKSSLTCYQDSTSLSVKLYIPYSATRHYHTKVYMVDKKGNPCYIQKYATRKKLPPHKIWDLEMNIFMKVYENLIADDKLFFCVTITDFSIINMDQYELKDECIQTSRQKDDVACLDSLSADFRKLLVSGAEYDVMLKSGNWQFPVHKTVLSSRSAIFSAMFRSNMRETKDGVVDIEDIHPLDMEQFLKYIYSSKVDDLTQESAIRLYEIADKYAVDSLMKKCSDFLIEVLTPENACMCLLLADAHNDRAFKFSAINYIIQREEIMKTREWAAISIQHPNLGVEVLTAHFQAIGKQ